MNSLYTIILAAGQGKRMKSATPKVLHKIGGWPLIRFPLALAARLKPDQVVLVVPKEHEEIEKTTREYSLSKNAQLTYAVQAQQRGTGDALACALKHISAKSGMVLLMNGDMPLISPQTVQSLIREHQKAGAVLSLATVQMENQTFPYGRIIRDERGELKAVVEERDCTPAQKNINELNCGVYLLDLEFARAAVKKIKPVNAQGEYYVTDLVKMAFDEKLPIASAPLKKPEEAMGVNSQRELACVRQQFHQWQHEALWAQGVQLLGQDIHMDVGVKVGAGSQLTAPCFLYGNTQIGKGVMIEPGAVIYDSSIADGARIKAFTYLENARVGKNCQIGPFAHLRPGTELAEDVKIGNFVETKKVKVGSGSKINHLAYMGDAVIGRKVNVGAGTITCNYDGVKKFRTVLEDEVFIGSDTQLVAPVRVGKGAVVGAGTTVTKNVKSGSLVVSRIPQKEIAGWALRRSKL